MKVICEHFVSGNCSPKSCAAASENTVPDKNCVFPDAGIPYYKYVCRNEDENKNVKLIDVRFVGKKVDPNILFRKLGH